MVSPDFMHSINPATEEVLGSYRILSEQQTEEALDRAQKAFRTWSSEKFSARASLMKKAADISSPAQGQIRGSHDGGDGETGGRIGSGSRKMRMELRLLRRQRRAVPLRRAPHFECGGKLYPIRAIGSGARGHALELPFLAGLPICSARFDGREHGNPETCIECSAVRPGH